MTVLTMRRDGASAWRLTDAAGAEVGGIRYVHANDGHHYQPWLFVDGVLRRIGEPLPQLAMAARAIEARAIEASAIEAKGVSRQRTPQPQCADDPA